MRVADIKEHEFLDMKTWLMKCSLVIFVTRFSRMRCARAVLMSCISCSRYGGRGPGFTGENDANVMHNSAKLTSTWLRWL